MNDEEKAIEQIIDMLQRWDSVEERISILIEIIYALGCISGEPMDAICLVHAFVVRVHQSFHTEKKMDAFLRKALGHAPSTTKKKPKKGS